MLRNYINPELVIEEVKRRPVLYDYTGPPEVRKTHWEEVAQSIFHEVWEQSGENERFTLVKEVQTKWKSLRDAYHRARRTESMEMRTPTLKRRKKYVFYDKLAFLGKGTTRSLNAVFLQENDSKTNDSDQDFYEEANSSSSVPDDNHSIKKGGEETDSTKNSEDRLKELLGEIVAVQKADKADDKMGNKKFLLSLLPFMERLPDDVNLEVRLQLMSVLQMYLNRSS